MLYLCISFERSPGAAGCFQQGHVWTCSAENEKKKKWHFLILHLVASSVSDELHWAKAPPWEASIS